MKTTGIFTVYRYEIPFKKYGDTVKLVPFGDIHWGAPLWSEKIWGKFIDRYKDDKTAYFVGMGDYLDELSTSERKAYINSDYHDSTLQNSSKFYNDRALTVAKQIKFMKGRLIGLCEGNHYFQMADGTTTTNTLCHELDTMYLGVKTFIELILKYRDHSHRVIICIHHGEGGGRRSSSSVGKLENMAHTHDADIILQGHDHRKNHIELTRIGITRSANHGKPNVIEKTIYCARTGGFLRGYIDQHQSYIVDSNLPPNSLGNVEFHLTPKRKSEATKVKDKSKKYDSKPIDKRWVNIEFHACNYTEH